MQYVDAYIGRRLRGEREGERSGGNGPVYLSRKRKTRTGLNAYEACTCDVYNKLIALTNEVQVQGLSSLHSKAQLDEKSVLPQGNRAMPQQLFFIV